MPALLVRLQSSKKGASGWWSRAVTLDIRITYEKPIPMLILKEALFL